LCACRREHNPRRRHDQGLRSLPRAVVGSGRCPLTGKRQAMCASMSCGFSCASSLRGGCSTGASLQSRSPTLTPPRPNASPANPALPARGERVRRPPCSGGRSRPWLTDGYPSLRAKRRSTPRLQGPNPAIRRPNRASALAWPAAGQMRTYVLGRTVDTISAKGLQTSNYVEVISVDRERSSGGLLRS
jgi:hypothetical protein